MQTDRGIYHKRVCDRCGAVLGGRMMNPDEYFKDWAWTKNETALHSNDTTLKPSPHSKIKRSWNSTTQSVHTFLKEKMQL